MKTDKQLKKEQDILVKAIQQAIDNGFNAAFTSAKEVTVYYPLYDNKPKYETMNLKDVIFNHDFAEALWGDFWANFTEGQSGDTFSLQAPNWKGHLMNMVIAVNPINYLGKNI